MTYSDETIKLLLKMLRGEGDHLLGHEFDTMIEMIGRDPRETGLINRLDQALEVLGIIEDESNLWVDFRVVSIDLLIRVLIIAQMIPETFDMAGFD